MKAAILGSVITATMLCSQIAGCATKEITGQNVDQLMHDFQSGQLQLSTSGPSIGNTGWFSTRFFDLYNHRKWVELSKLVIESDSADDLSWYMLGVSAEGLGYAGAAQVYYDNSINVRLKYCYPGPFYLATVCAGLQLPEDAYAKLRQLDYRPKTSLQ